MRLPSAHGLSDAFVLGGAALFTGVVMQWGPLVPVAPAPPPPPPAGEVFAGPLMMGDAPPMDPLVPSIHRLAEFEGALYEENPEGEEETAFFHLGDLYEEVDLHGTGLPFGSVPGSPQALAPFDPFLGSGAVEAFGIREPSARAQPAGRPLLLQARQNRAPLAGTASVLDAWWALFAPKPDERAADPFFDRPGKGGQGPLRVTLPPVFLGGLATASGRPIFGGVDYSDPTGVGLPLLRVLGHEADAISPHFRVGDFATRDGAPLARIAPRLVQGLERLRDAVGPFYVISGYRHPAYNAAVGGRSISRHMAGQAADLYAPSRSSIELAREAIAAFGCGIGLGLGQKTVHIDVRGYLSTWTYPGAPLSEATFDLWVLMLCDRVQPEDLGALLQVEWTLPDSLSDVDLLNRLRWLSDDGVPPDSVTRENAEELLRQRRLLLAAYARSGFRSAGPGAVIVDLSAGLPGAGAPLARSYLASRTPEADRLGLTPLVEWVVAQRHQDDYFVYAVRYPDGHTDVGIMATGTTDAPGSEQPAEPSALGEEPALGPAPTESGAEPGIGWRIVVNSTPDAVEAERDAARYRRVLQGTPHRVSIRHVEDDGARYRVVVGPFETAAAARRTLDVALAGVAPRDAWLLPPGN